MSNLVIRRETKEDYRRVEEITREAFWNIYAPGCDEHYLAHIIRDSSDFIPELAFVAESNEQIVGSILFTKSYILDNQGIRHETITFGPISVLPERQKQGIGAALIEHAKEIAAQLSYKAIVIYGDPGYYERFGFINAKEYGITNPDGKYPLAHMVLELYEGALNGISGKAYESELFYVDQTANERFDASFEPKEKLITESQKRHEEIVNSFL